MQIYILTSHLKMRCACLSHFHISRIAEIILFKHIHKKMPFRNLSHREKTEVKAGVFKRRNCFTLQLTNSVHVAVLYQYKILANPSVI